jgi:hypothetical protein
MRLKQSQYPTKQFGAVSLRCCSYLSCYHHFYFHLKTGINTPRSLYMFSTLLSTWATGSNASQSSPQSGYTASPGNIHVLNNIEYMVNGVQCNPVLSSVWLHCLTRYIHVLTRYIHVLTGYIHVLNIIEYMGNGVQCNPVLFSVWLHCLTRHIHVLNIIKYICNGVQCNPFFSSDWLHCLTRYIHVLTRYIHALTRYIHVITRYLHVLNIIEYMGNGVQCNPVLSSVWLHCLTRYIHVLTR